jgi:mannose-6-phosphate isomerase-like protein (cupin superfamily)
VHEPPGCLRSRSVIESTVFGVPGAIRQQYGERRDQGGREQPAKGAHGVSVVGKDLVRRSRIPDGLKLFEVSRKEHLAEKFGRFTDQWSPKIVADLNDSHVKLAKVQGEFVWHQHADEDELFIVVKGELTIQLRDGDVTLGPGELVVIPKGIEHRPVAAQEVELMLIEPKATRHTGDVVSERTVHEYARI